MNILTKHAIRCRKCGDVIESKSISDVEKCSCGACKVEGGLVYPRIYAASSEDYDDLSEYSEVEGCTVYVKTHIKKIRYSFKCPLTQVNDVILSHEDDAWDDVCVIDEKGEVIYKSTGFGETP